MIARRDLLIGGACVAAAGTAYALKPRREVLLLPADRDLQEFIPTTMAGWIGQDVGDPMALNQEGSLAARLYNQVVTRLYTNSDSGAQVMMLLAYGAKQNDDLQLHRPEVCYPAFGFTLVANQRTQVPLRAGVTVPARRLVAENDAGRQYITYWSRLGEFLPQGGEEQREARFLNAFKGIVPDGVLCRFNVVAPSEALAWGALDKLIQDLVGAMPPVGRRVLLGTERAAALSR